MARSKKGKKDKKRKLGDDPKPSTSKSTANSEENICHDSKPSTSKSTANSEENISPNRQASKRVKPGAMQEENSSDDEPSPPKAVKTSPKKLAKKSIEKSDDSKPSTSKSTGNSEENICHKKQAKKKVKPRSMQEKNSSDDKPSPPKTVKKILKKLAKKNIEKSPDDSEPSTSKSTANSEENICSKRQAVKKVKPGAMQEENSSGNKPSPKKLAKKNIKSPVDFGPSTSKSTANSEENISLNKQASKKVKPAAIQEENLSGNELSLPNAIKTSPKKLAKKNMEKSPDSKPSTSKCRENSEENISPNRQDSKRVSWCPSTPEKKSSGNEHSPKKPAYNSSYYGSKGIEERQKKENKVKEIEVNEYPPFCCNSIRPETDQEAIFNQFMEKRGSMDRIFEVIRRESNGREFISIKYFDLHEGIRTEIPQKEATLTNINWRTKITILKTDCESHNRNFELNSLQKRMAGPWKVEPGPTVDYSDYRPRPKPEENSSGDKPSPPKAVKKSPKKLANQSIEKSPDDPKPSTSKSTANSEENISPNRQDSKKEKPEAMPEENSSADDPSLPKAAKKSSKKKKRNHK